MADPTLLLRDVHESVAPSWWPPAPGWWMVFAAVLLVVAAVWLWRARRQRRRRAIERVFDDALAEAATPSAQVAAMSELLRRAARRRDATADRLQGEDWLAFLDRSAKSPQFVEAAGRLLLDGGYRRDVDPLQAEALRELVRTRFLELMGAGR
ncbi:MULTISPECIES: DUF4381 domain-containing protein [unclassified Lysobacter]|uniref:DUF4381 domain-containing protein n=1 Tax=unclassified Lysobacter TaxID=2635362 RepID=UPI0006FF0932|nr:MULTISPECIES: DUF4381 domain-containing protein [unclassified Lysobacter]KQZ60356.1 hypothetical protein ASD53_04260 [Lysobacter sp. Root559]KRC38797.1 hypothetical protein ASE10_04560 [Lysobacter sp. Root76]KRD70998.1 hypothetical protein ASE45_03890 [Lysobacter sp. Root96]